jgi:hypothetical protein
MVRAISGYSVNQIGDVRQFRDALKDGFPASDLPFVHYLLCVKARPSTVQDLPQISWLIG